MMRYIWYILHQYLTHSNTASRVETNFLVIDQGANLMRATEIADLFVAAAHRLETERLGIETGSLFALQGAAVTEFALSNPQGLLPLLVWHASGMHKYINKQDLGAVIEKDEAGLIGYCVDLDGATKSNSELVCYLMEAICDIHEVTPSAGNNPKTKEISAFVVDFQSAMLAKERMREEALMSAGTEFSVQP